MGLEVSQIIKLVADFGVMVVIAAVFLYTAIRVINILLKGLEMRVGNRKHDKLIDLRSSIDQKIQQMLDQFLEHSNGDRIQVVEFSNSVMSIAYLPFKYMTCTYEVYRAGKAAMGSRLDHLSTSLFTTFFTNLQENEYCILDDADTSATIGGAMHDLLITSGEPKALCTLLQTVKGKAVGYIIMKKEEDFTDEDIEGIQSLADQIAALLSVVDK